MRIRFTKMHGLGNDFMVIDGVTQAVRINPGQIRQLADRRLGIGFDQLLLLQPPSIAEADFDYRIFNPDGTEVEHCGNGARCCAVFAREQGLSHRNPLRVKTINRVLYLETAADGNITVDMGQPVFAPQQIPFRNESRSLTYQRSLRLHDETIDVEFCALSMGNPHAVIPVEETDTMAVKDIGEALGRHADFPQGVNVGCMEIINPQCIKLRVFERGTGETPACGSGACAAVVAGHQLGLLTNPVQVMLAGGSLTVDWAGDRASVQMSGPATTVYQGSIEL